MKLLIGVLTILLVNFSTYEVKAESFWEATGKVMQKYGIPCAAGMAAGYVIDHDKGLGVGTVGCAIVFTYGEFGRGSNRTVTNDDLDLIQDMINKSNGKLSSTMKEEYDSKIDHLGQRLTDESLANRQNIRNAVTDLGVFLEKDLSDKVDKQMENPKLVQQVDEKINLRVKEEVQSEYRSKEREIVEKTTEKVIKRVTAEPIVLDQPKPTPPSQ